MARVKCDSCGDKHECATAAAPAATGKNGKPKRALHPAMIARNDAAKKAKADREAKGGSVATSTTPAAGTPKGRSIVRDLLWF